MLAVEDDILLPAETTPQLLDQTQQMIERRVTKDRDQNAVDRRANKICVGKKAAVPLQGQHVFVEPGTMVDSEHAVRTFGIKLTGEVHRASIFVVSDLAMPSLEVRLAARLLGGSLVAPVFLRDGRGAAVTYKAAVASRRRLWMSIAFCRAHADCARIVVAAATSGASKWRFVDQAAFLTRPGRRWEDIALVTNEEKASDELRDMDVAMHGEEFSHWAGSIGDTSLGACGK